MCYNIDEEMRRNKYSKGGWIVLEVVFSQSAKDSIKLSKKYTRASTAAIDGISGFSSKSLLENRSCGGENRQGVVQIGAALDVGDLADTYSDPTHGDGVSAQASLHFLQEHRGDVRLLMEHAADGGPVRIWHSDAPGSICGLHYVCYLLRDSDCKIHAISLPKYRQAGSNQIIQYGSWNEVSPMQIAQFLPLQREISAIERRMLAGRWSDLAAENAPLRAQINGKLFSVDEDFYDRFIRRCLPQSNFLMAQLIGEVMCAFSLGVYDWWYALRIEKMVKSGELLLVKDDTQTNRYHKILRKADAT